MGYYWVIFLLLTRYYILRNTLCTYNIRRGNRLPILYRKSNPKKIVFACLLPPCLILLSILQSFSEIENILQKIVDIKKNQLDFQKNISLNLRAYFFFGSDSTFLYYTQLQSRECGKHRLGTTTTCIQRVKSRLGFLSCYMYTMQYTTTPKQFPRDFEQLNKIFSFSAWLIAKM